MYIYTQMAFWWINMAWTIRLEVQRLATFTLWIHVFMTTVSFAPLSFDTQKFCIPSKLWPHGRTVEWWSKQTGPRCVGNQVEKCSGVSIWSHTSQKKPKKNVITSCGSLCTCTPLRVGLFILLFWHISSEQTQADEQEMDWNLVFGVV